jgi:hypothetical protein
MNMTTKTPGHEEEIARRGLMKRLCRNRKKGFKLECGRAQRPAPTRDYRTFVGVRPEFVFTRNCDTASKSSPYNKRANNETKGLRGNSYENIVQNKKKICGMWIFFFQYAIN